MSVTAEYEVECDRCLTGERFAGERPEVVAKAARRGWKTVTVRNFAASVEAESAQTVDICRDCYGVLADPSYVPISSKTKDGVGSGRLPDLRAEEAAADRYVPSDEESLPASDAG